MKIKTIIIILILILILLSGCESRVIDSKKKLYCKDICIKNNSTFNSAFESKKTMSCLCEITFLKTTI